MTHAAHLLVFLNFCLVGALPRIFFKRGILNARWFLTASPFALAAGAVVASWFDVVEPWGGDDGARQLASAGVALSAASLYLIGFTMGANRIPLALWHQDDDAPAEIVTWGPYAWVRHPFYTSFLAAFLAAVCVAPSAATIVPAVVGGIALGITARREERRLLASSLGAPYGWYAARTGRFLPVVGRLRPPTSQPAAATTGALP
jgi:protein-S-isoprenylcysteine O-methyltransferase Ste14